MKFLPVILLGLMLSACSHTINFRASHFAIPVTGEDQWSGHVAATGTAISKITVVNDMTSNPPNTNPVRINADIDAGDIVGVNYIGFDASLTLLKRLDLILDNSLLGLRVQVLNHGAGPENWVAAIHGAMGNRDVKNSQESSGNTSEAKSEVKTTQLGVSVGYKFAAVIPYVSYIHEKHETSTRVTNTHGSFGPYENNGTHQYYSIGLTTYQKGLRFGLEYNRINLDWKNALDSEWQDAIGVKLGFAW